MKAIKAKSYKDFQKELERLQAEHYHLQSIFKVAPIGIALVVEEKIGFVNDQFCNIMGCKNNNLIGKNFEDVFPDKSEYQRIFEKHSAEIKKKGICKIETKFKRKDGAIIDIYLSSTLLDPDDQSLGTTYTALDITEHKKTEIKLRTQIEQNEQILKTTLDGYVLTDMEGKIVDVNQSYCEMIGYSREELLQMNIREIGVQLSSEEFEQRIKQMVDQGRARFEAKHKRKDGVILDLDVSVVIMNFDKGSFVTAFLRDITEQNRVKEEIRRKEEQFRTVIEAAGDAMFVADFETTQILLVNKQACKTLGYTQKELLTKTVSDLDPAFNEQCHQKNIWVNLNEEEAITIEIFYKRKDGTVFPAEVRVGIIKYNGKKAVLGFARDISERKKTEQMLLESEEKYRMLVETSGDIILLQGMNGRILYINQTGLDFIGSTRSEIEGKLITDFISQEYIELLNKKFEQRLKGDTRTYHYEIGINLESDQVIPLEINSSPIIKDNKITSILVIARDISERKQTEIELKQYREKLEELVKKRTLELEEKNKELEEYNDIFIGREFRIKELKEKLKTFENKRNDKKL